MSSIMHRVLVAICLCFLPSEPGALAQDNTPGPREVLQTMYQKQKEYRTYSYIEYEGIRKLRALVVAKTDADGFKQTARFVFAGSRALSVEIENRQGNWTVHPEMVVKRDFQTTDQVVPQGTEALMEQYPKELSFEWLPEKTIEGVACYGIKVSLSKFLIDKLQNDLKRAIRTAKESERDVRDYLAVERRFYIGKNDYLAHEQRNYDYLQTPIVEFFRTQYQINAEIPDDSFSVPQDRPINIAHNAGQARAFVARVRVKKSFEDTYKVLTKLLAKQTNSANARLGAPGNQGVKQ